MTPSPTAAEALAPAAPALSARARWTIVGLLATALFINYVDRGAVPTAAHLIQDEIGLSPRQLGLLFSAFFWSYSLLQIPVGWVAERYGAQRVLAAGLAIWACATMLVGLAHSFAASWRCACCSASARARVFPQSRSCS
ncbi:MAG: MFS transporter, partial [Gammaproteobacteria bacterium]